MTERPYRPTSAQPGWEGSIPLISETYATLINRKALVPSVNTPYFAIEQHLFFRLMEVALEDIDIDEDWYLSQNSDVADAIRNGSVRDAGHHYRRFGFYEHRLPYPIAVAEAWYLGVYDDVRAGLLQNAFPSAQSHFETMGFREGRLPYPNFILTTRMPKPTAPPHALAASPAVYEWPEAEA